MVSAKRGFYFVASAQRMQSHNGRWHKWIGWIGEIAVASQSDKSTFASDINPAGNIPFGNHWLWSSALNWWSAYGSLHLIRVAESASAASSIFSE
jgi:hypothetical protein